MSQKHRAKIVDAAAHRVEVVFDASDVDAALRPSNVPPDAELARYESSGFGGSQREPALAA